MLLKSADMDYVNFHNSERLEAFPMIISASRRTDIPAFYSEWFVNRLKEKFLFVRNPINRKQISRVSLSPDFIECIVFWTKNPVRLMPFLPEIDALGHHYYFQFTITPYGEDLEPNVPVLDQRIEIFRQLSSMIGKEKVIWRYDPIFFTENIDEDWHCAVFDSIARSLNGYTDKCIISFVDMYQKITKRAERINLSPLDEAQQLSIAVRLNKSASANGIKIDTCAEKISLENIGISRGQCISDTLISSIIGKKLNVSKDKTQREQCGCVKSIDIGAYDTCQHQCLYCYASANEEKIYKNIQLHNPDSALLIGEPAGDEKITDRKLESFIIS